MIWNSNMKPMNLCIMPTFQLVFKFEDYTKIINDGKEHMYIIAEYVNADDSVLCKWQSEDFDELLDMIKEWNDTNKIK